MDVYLRSQLKTEPEDALAAFKDGSMVGQKRTSKFKPLVFMKGGVVLKGPYSLRGRGMLLAQTLFRCNLFGRVWKNGCSIVGPLELVRFGESNDDVYFRMPHLGSSTSAWSGSEQPILGEEKPMMVADKKSQGLVEFSTYLERDDIDTSVVVDALIHYMHRFVVDPIVGDAALRNVLVRCVAGEKHKAFGIDFEENRTGDAVKRLAELNGSIFDMIEGGKKWRCKPYLASVLINNQAHILAHLRFDIGGNWDMVDALIRAHGVTFVSLELMKKRHAALLLAIEKSVAQVAVERDALKRKLAVASEAAAVSDETDENAKRAKTN